MKTGFFHKGIYKCVCGRIFDNSQAYNGHKNFCEDFQLQKYGNLKQFAINRNRQKNNTKIMIKNNLAKLKKIKDDKKRLWVKEKHKCEACGKILKKKFGSGRFCSKSCACSRSHSLETRIKISKGLKEYNLRNPGCNSKIKDGLKKVYYCSICGKQLHHKTKTGMCKKCYNESELAKENGRKAAAKTQHYWITRNVTSYAEKFWIKVLKNNNIKFEREKAVKKKSNGYYFLDFYIKINETKLDLEIDGKQHLLPERKKHDKKRDRYLKKQGFLIYRIPWNNINTEKGKELMKDKISKFVSYYESLGKNQICEA